MHALSDPDNLYKTYQPICTCTLFNGQRHACISLYTDRSANYFEGNMHLHACFILLGRIMQLQIFHLQHLIGHPTQGKDACRLSSCKQAQIDHWPDRSAALSSIVRYNAAHPVSSVRPSGGTVYAILVAYISSSGDKLLLWSVLKFGNSVCAAATALLCFSFLFFQQAKVSTCLAS